MKRILLIVLAAIFAVSAFAGCSKKSSTDAKETTTPEITTTPPDVDVIDFNMDTWVSDGHVKVIGEQKIPEDFVTDTKIYMAKMLWSSFCKSSRGLKGQSPSSTSAEVEMPKTSEKVPLFATFSPR